MPSGRRPTNILVLVEDRAQQKFIRTYLSCLGLDHPPRYEPLPRGSGSGEQYVRERFPVLLQESASSLGRGVSSLAIVMIDADRLGATQRKQQLLGNIVPPEHLLLLVPARNVETWVAALLGETVDEVQDYKPQFNKPDSIKRAAEHLYALTRPNTPIPSHLPASLRDAIPEFNKIELRR